jgi:DNA-binding Xre family transcriptional regulator
MEREPKTHLAPIDDEDAPPTTRRFDTYLDERGVREEVHTAALKEVVAWRLDQMRKKRQVTKQDLATRMGTSRPQVRRILDPKASGGLTLETIARAAEALGYRIRVEFDEVDAS